MPDEHSTPPDQSQRERALDAGRSVLVRAPAGSGKTDLLTRRFLLLLGEVSDPGEIAAITFTKAAAAEMRHRILSELEKAASGMAGESGANGFSMALLARRALARSHALGWNLIDLPAQLRISTIDSFCREIAMQEPILSGLGGSFEIYEQPRELYRRAARRTLEQIGKGGTALSAAIETLLLWRDNNWGDLEDQVVEMLARRDQWMQEDFLDRDPGWDVLRKQLERPFARRIRALLAGLDLLFEQTPGALEDAHELARFACEQSGGQLHGHLAELADFPSAPYTTAEELEQALGAYRCLADLLLTSSGFRQRVDKRHGFPTEAKKEKGRLAALIASLAEEPAFEVALAAVRDLPSARYPDEEWEIVRAAFVLLRHASGELRVAFAETASTDFVEVAQLAQKALQGDDGLPSDAAQAFADRIRHLLVDEFQDTSRRQHRLFSYFVGAWSGREGRTCFVVGDPMQSIYGFRDAEAELFSRVERLGLEVPGDLPLLFDSVQLVANFRSAPSLVHGLNRVFSIISAEDDGSGIDFTPAQAARSGKAPNGPRIVDGALPPLQLHLEFMPASRVGSGESSFEEPESFKTQRERALEKQTEAVVALVRGHLRPMEAARAVGEKYRIAVLGRARKDLAPIAAALRKAAISFRAMKLEPLLERPEIADALALTRALCNPEDRVAWLGVLRAPWCGLSLADLHTVTSADDEELKLRPVPELLAERSPLLGEEGRIAVARVLDAVALAARSQSAWPTASPGTRMEQAWLRLGGAQCVDGAARANLDLFWRSLDELPEGGPDLPGSALDAALAGLCALPDPAPDAECGVQLTTMHGAKGLEFEVVIVPELQAPSRQNKPEMLSWLERGLPPEESDADANQITEFLVAPFPPKGSDRGLAKAWVDRVRTERERQEARRIFYVAATRAREELHLFARPEFKFTDAGLSLVEPGDSLLKTAWPALRDEVERRFEEWKIAASAHSGGGQTVESLAASAESAIAIAAPAGAAEMKPARIRRLPPNYRSPSVEILPSPAQLIGEGSLYERHEGGPLARALGKAVHDLLQRFAELRVAESHEAARASLASFMPRITAMLRATGADEAEAGRIAAQALAIVADAGNDPQAQWILAPHAEAASEVRWTGVVSGALRTVQVDRVFRAGLAPQAKDGDYTWWIVDYKTAYSQDNSPDGQDRRLDLSGLRSLFGPQIEAYAKVLRNLRGRDVQVRGGLYYPRMKALDWWEL